MTKDNDVKDRNRHFGLKEIERAGKIAERVRELMKHIPPRYPVPIPNRAHPNDHSVHWVWQF